MNELTIDSLESLFLNHRMQKDLWTHEAHFVVATCILMNENKSDALAILRNLIKANNDFMGVQNTTTSGYHETLTWFYIGEIEKILAKNPSADKYSAVTQILASPIVAKTYPLNFYSKELLFSPKARAEIVLPDLIRAPESKMKIQIRPAKAEEMHWINSCYNEIKFIPSNFQTEYIAIAEVNDQKAGLGRLVNMPDGALELGGIYVLEPYRKFGLAKKIITHLLIQAPQQKIYCIPFKHLRHLYESFGFTLCSDVNAAPESIQKKYSGCQSQCNQGVFLLETTTPHIL